MLVLRETFKCCWPGKQFARVKGLLMNYRVLLLACFDFAALRRLFFQSFNRYLYFVFEVLVVLSNVGHDEILWAVKLRRFSALRLLRAICKEKQLFLKFDLSFTTFYATITWLENGVSLRQVYTSDMNTSKTGRRQLSAVRSSTIQ